MLVTMKSILEKANEDNYGIMAMNSVNMEMIRAALMAAEEEYSPFIIQIDHIVLSNYPKNNQQLHNLLM